MSGPSFSEKQELPGLVRPGNFVETMGALFIRCWP
jgi:hypothetical protein